MSEFDYYAPDYDLALNRGLSISGEDKNFFAKGRVDWLSRCLKELTFAPKRLLDFGCGTGTSTPFLVEALAAESIVGVDLSTKSLEVARQIHSGLPIEYKLSTEYIPKKAIDLVFCNGVFHHIAPEYRRDALKYIVDCLRPGGLFALWENNPWNPGTRYIMSKIPFDKDAITLSARAARRLAESVGLRIVRTDYCFFFPRILRNMRRVEHHLVRLPFGAQYQVLCQKSVDDVGVR